MIRGDRSLRMPRGLPLARPTWTQALTVALVVILGGTAFAVGLWLSGCRWFVVQTPSMATTAPVGTVVVVAPTRQPQVGEVIAFRPPGLDRVYTHRVVEVLPDGAVRTRGDLNGADDAWTTPVDRIVGRAVLLVPGIGFITRAVPLLILGGVLVWQITASFRTPERRAAGRISGMHLVVSAVLLFLHPLTSFDLLATRTGPDGLRASVVSTGLLPITLTSGAGDPLASLHDGQLAVVPLAVPTSGHVVLNAVLDLDWPAHVGLIALTLLPAICMILVGLPTDPFPTGVEDDPAPARGRARSRRQAPA